MQAIEVCYLGPTNTKGSRFVVECDGGRLVIPQDYSLNPMENATAAAVALIKKLGWDGQRGLLARGQLKRGSWVFVFTYGDPLNTGERFTYSETVNYK